jgi:peptidoglycan hydrolase CwlO-like protein
MELEIYSAFKAAGVPDENARAAAESINKAIDERYALHSRQLATQGDIEKVRVEIEKVRAEIEKVRAEIAKVEANLIKWNVGAILAATGLAMAVARVFLVAG